MVGGGGAGSAPLSLWLIPVSGPQGGLSLAYLVSHPAGTQTSTPEVPWLGAVGLVSG